MVKYISSTQNSLIKNILLLKDKSRERKKQRVFVLEGIRELRLAIKGKYQINTVLFYADLISLEEVNKLINENDTVELIEISKDVYQKIAYRSTTEGMISLIETKDFSIGKICYKNKKPLILIAEAPEKPGNIGALLRTADAANVDAVIIANPLTDMYNPNIIRSSVGCLFTNKIGTGTTSEIISFLKENNIQPFAAALHDESENYLNQNFTKASAIIVGTEATGLSNEWLDFSKKIIIPMEGEIDSLNVSVSASILIFEAKRQRNLANYDFLN